MSLRRLAGGQLQTRPPATLLPTPDQLHFLEICADATGPDGMGGGRRNDKIKLILALKKR